jgi:hypothetical protein
MKPERALIRIACEQDTSSNCRRTFPTAVLSLHCRATMVTPTISADARLPSQYLAMLRRPHSFILLRQRIELNELVEGTPTWQSGRKRALGTCPDLGRTHLRRQRPAEC